MPVDEKTAPPPFTASTTLIDGVRRYFKARDHQRRGICLLNAGVFNQAALEFSAAMNENPDSNSLPDYLVRAYIAQRKWKDAADVERDRIDGDGDDVAARIRHALLLWKNGDAESAVASLRTSVAECPNCAELHFQLGNLLADIQDLDEAELRYTAAVDLDGRHADAMVNLAMCLAAKQDSARALRLLQRAQSVRPRDARIGFLLGMACQATQDGRACSNTPLEMPADDDTNDESAVGRLAEIFENDPEFVEAFGGLTDADVDDQLYHVLAATLRRAIIRRPASGELNYHLAWVSHRMGRNADAVAAAERCVEIDPGHVRAWIHLGRLYHFAGRSNDAVDSLERTIALGARYADVYMLLGSIYRETGRTGQARHAYQQALRINDGYHAARTALESLAV
ncbi:MAG: tetratricopeptide repeat protein [Phycisphaerales bacterium]|nr:tetratricopeptide repeat protein [Phycisphaerales bacterium]